MPDPDPAPADEEPSPGPGVLEIGGHSAPPAPEPEPEPEPAPSAAPVEVVVNLNTNGGGPPSSGSHPAVAAAKPDVEDQIKLIEAQRGFWDRFINSAVLPIALLIVGPACTYYFATRADEGLKAVKNGASEVEELKKIVTTLSGTLQRADLRLGEMEEARAAELRAMTALSARLDRTVQSALIQMVVGRLMEDRRVGLLGAPGVMPRTERAPSRVEVIRRAVEQVSLPGVDSRRVAELAGAAYDRTAASRALWKPFLVVPPGTEETSQPTPVNGPVRQGPLELPDGKNPRK
jgi:hypothetical protein